MCARFASRSEHDIAQLAFTVNYIYITKHLFTETSGNNGVLGAKKHTVFIVTIVKWKFLFNST